MDIQRLKGQEHIKHALEVAAVGDHTLTLMSIGCYDDAEHYIKPIANDLGMRLLYVLRPCPCGYYGDTEVTCTCTEDMRSEYRGYELSQRATDMYLEMLRPTYEKLFSARLGEPSSVVKERIDHYKKLLPTVSHELDAAGQSLMKAACRQLAFTQYQNDTTLRVARTIAAMANAKSIGAAHLAEAIQYRPKRG